MATSGTRSSLKHVISWILQALLALLFAVQGFVKIMGSSNWVTRFNRWGYPHHFYLVVGAAELVGAAMLLVPKTVKFGVLLLSMVMIGAAGTHLVSRAAGHDHACITDSARDGVIPSTSGIVKPSANRVSGCLDTEREIVFSKSEIEAAAKGSGRLHDQKRLSTRA